MDIRKIKKLIDLLKETDVCEIEITEGEENIRITRPGANNISYQSMPIQTQVQQNQPQQQIQGQDTAVKTNEQAPINKVEGNFIKSPMVGTFYSAPSPDASDFVKAGDDINVGDPVCIVEAMKMFNRIEAETSGKIKRVLVQNGEPVEFDQPIFEIE